MTQKQAPSPQSASPTAPKDIALTRKTAPSLRYCPHPRLTTHATTAERIRVPCGRPRCSHECRDRWAKRMATCLRRSFRDLAPTHEARVTVFAGISDQEL